MIIKQEGKEKSKEVSKLIFYLFIYINNINLYSFIIIVIPFDIVINLIKRKEKKMKRKKVVKF